MFENKNKGFTIIELIVVIAIIAVLAAIVLVNVTSYIAKARNAKRIEDIRNYVTALQIYYGQHGGYPQATPGWGTCLGRYSSSHGMCGLHDGTPADGGVNAAIQDILPGWPEDTTKINFEGTEGSNYWRGYFYTTDGYQGIVVTCAVGLCDGATIEYNLEGGNSQPCGIGKPDNTRTEIGATPCQYTLGGQ